MTPTISQEDWEAADALLTGKNVGGGDGGTYIPRAPGRAELAEAFALLRQQAEQKLAEHLADPWTVHANMLRGSIARLSADQIWHIYQRALLDAMPENFRGEICQQARLAALEEAAGIAMSFRLEGDWDWDEHAGIIGANETAKDIHDAIRSLANGERQ